MVAVSIIRSKNIILAANYEYFNMISRKHHKIVFSFFMSLLMSCIMSFVISVFNVGIVTDIISVWFKAWAFAFVVAFPTIIMVSPIVHKLVNLVLCKKVD